MLTTAIAPERDLAGADPAFRADVLKGLAQPAKTVPARWFYDMRGSQLFEAITKQPEYYPTRIETALLREHAGAVAWAMGAEPVVVEFGSGSSLKTRLLLQAMLRATYVPIDICGEFMEDACEGLARLFPELEILPVEADFTQPLRLPLERDSSAMLGFFPGSTIGNLLPSAAVDLLRAMRKTLGEGARLLIGIDRVKDTQTLLRAYDDAEGVTAEFNLNLAHRINRELDGTIPVEALAHEARWNPAWNRVEMHLRARRAIRFEVCGRMFAMAKGETIHTENCHKYTPDQIGLLLHAGGWDAQEHWSDPDGMFSLVLAEATGETCGP